MRRPRWNLGRDSSAIVHRSSATDCFILFFFFVWFLARCYFFLFHFFLFLFRSSIGAVVSIASRILSFLFPLLPLLLLLLLFCPAVSFLYVSMASCGSRFNHTYGLKKKLLEGVRNRPDSQTYFFSFLHIVETSSFMRVRGRRGLGRRVESGKVDGGRWGAINIFLTGRGKFRGQQLLPFNRWGSCASNNSLAVNRWCTAILKHSYGSFFSSSSSLIKNWAGLAPPIENWPLLSENCNQNWKILQESWKKKFLGNLFIMVSYFFSSSSWCCFISFDTWFLFVFLFCWRCLLDCECKMSCGHRTRAVRGANWQRCGRVLTTPPADGITVTLSWETSQKHPKGIYPSLPLSLPPPPRLSLSLRDVSE